VPTIEVDVEPITMPPAPAQAPASRGWLVWVIVISVVLLGLLLVCGGVLGLVGYLMSRAVAA
jgi:hypothetical protein